MGHGHRSPLEKGYTMSDKAKALVTTEYDLADKALDKITFVMCAVSQMMGGYQDNVVNGLVEVLSDSTDEIRRYMDAARDVMLEVEAEQ